MALLLSSVIVGIKLGCLSLLFSVSTYEDRGNGVLSRMVVHLLIAVENSTAHWLKKKTVMIYISRFVSEGFFPSTI